ncbi:DUF1349 domain-containing protein [Paenibacillus sp. JJ-223]|uniref:DUF1349 domain-containing protein n=1 Tax=Paenibacillus sp. JJ-223 TaxID=2905647 RepID=UPI001F42CC5A|nr:DUF1349 domain-containing protein [Paenibacillus sp. JJ-223]CAH1199031.1 hypothetical protein PAECIP111890_01458 [Paenibacillus sp. JJ-223]
MINAFDSNTREQLSWINEPMAWSYTDQGSLTVEAQPDTDFFQDPAGINVRASAPFLGMPLPGDFEMTAQLTVDMKHQYDSGCLMLMADERNWCKLCFEFDGSVPTIVSVVTRDGLSDDCNSVEVTVSHPFLRIRKVEHCISFFYSPDGEEWKLIRYFGMPVKGELRGGVVAQSPTGTGCTCHFLSLQVTRPDLAARF